MLYPLAVSHPGPTWKTYSGVNARLGAVLHSAEGSLAGLLNGIDSGPYSWHFSVSKDGRVFAHYPLESMCWHSGSGAGNRETIGIEHEGRAGEPLTEAQVQASVALCRWLRDVCNWQTLEGRLFEHNQFSTTQCPSGRIPWYRYTEGDAPRNAEFVIPEEDEVQVTEIEQGETIAIGERIFHTFGKVISDDDGRRMQRVVQPSPPEGYEDFLIRIKRSDQ